MKNILWNLINNFTGKGFSLIFSLIIGNLLLPSEVGFYVALMLVVAYSVSLLNFEIGSAVVQKLNNVDLYDERDIYFSSGLFVTTSIALLAVFVAYLLKPWLTSAFQLKQSDFLLSVILPLIPVRLWRMYFNRVLQAASMFKSIAIVNLASAMIQICLTCLLVIFDYGVPGIIISVYCGNLVALIFMVGMSLKQYRLSLDPKTYKATKELLVFGSLIQIGTVAVFLDTKIDIFFINYFLTKEQVAIYNYAVQLALLLLLFGSAIGQVLFPKMTVAFTSNKSEEVNRIYRVAINYTFMILSTAGLFVIFHAHVLLPLILPAFYLKMVPCLYILIPAMVLFSSFSAVGTIFTARGLPAYGALVLWICLGINIGLNALLIPRFGMIGAAIATSVSFSLRAVITIFLVEVKIGTDFRYMPLIFCNTLLICIIVFGSMFQISFFFKELLVVLFFVFSLHFLLKDEIKRLFSDMGRHSFGGFKKKIGRDT